MEAHKKQILGSLKQTHDSGLVEFWSSNNSQLLQQLLVRDVHLKPGVQIDQCVCFGLGSLVPPNIVGPRWPGDTNLQRIENCKRSMQQLVFLAAFLHILVVVLRHPVHSVILQDPAFSQVDLDFFETLNFTGGTRSEGIEKLTSTTFVFAPYPDDIVIAKTFNKRSPTLFLGTKISIVRNKPVNPMLTKDDKSQWRSGCKALGTYEDNGSSEIMPAFDGDSLSWCSGLGLYWRAAGTGTL